MSDPLRLGIIGGGAVTQVAHLPALKKFRGVEVRAIADTDPAKASALAQAIFAELREAYPRENGGTK